MQELKQMYDVVDKNRDIDYEERERVKDPEQREYLVLIAGKYESDEWSIFIGRSEAYEYIKSEIDNINLDQSFVLVETVTLRNRISVYAFMKKCESLYNDSFDIDEYVKGDWDEDEFRRNNVHTGFINVNRMSMQNIMNEDTEIVSLT